MHDHHDETAAMEPIERPQPVRANVPQNQEAILAWALRYTEVLAEAPEVYETSAEEAAELRRLALAWSDARAGNAGVPQRRPPAPGRHTHRGIRGPRGRDPGAHRGGSDGMGGHRRSAAGAHDGR